MGLAGQRLRVAAAVIGLLFVVLLGGAIVFYESESGRGISFWDALYWAFITATTIGYGDIYPTTAAGRAVALAVAIAGIASFTALVGLAAEALVEGATRRLLGFGEVKTSNHVVILGYSPLTRRLIEELKANTDKEIVVVDENVPPLLAEKVAVVKGDPLDEEAYKKAGVERASHIVVDLVDDSRTVLAVLHARRANKHAVIIASVVDDKNVGIVRQAGANYVAPLSVVSMMLASFVYEPHVPAAIIDLAGSTDGGVDIVEESAAGYAGREFCSAISEAKRAENKLLLGVVRSGRVILNPPCGFRIEDSDRLLAVIGSTT